MAGLVRASIDYITATRASGTTGAALTRVRVGQIASITSQLGRMVVNEHSKPDATQALMLLGSVAPFTDEERDQLGTAINAAIAGANDVADPRGTQSQIHRYMFNYGTETKDERMESTVNLMHMIGLKYPDADTKKSIIALLIVAHGGRVSHLAAYKMLAAHEAQQSYARCTS